MGTTSTLTSGICTNTSEVWGTLLRCWELPSHALMPVSMVRTPRLKIAQQNENVSTPKWPMELQAVVRGFSPRVFIVYGLEKDDKLQDYLLMCPFRHTLDGRQRGGVFSWGDHQAEERHRQRSVAHYLQRLVQHFCHEEGQVLWRKHQVLNSVVWQWWLR